jgi:methyl-accepting chemotaxis protein
MGITTKIALLVAAGMFVSFLVNIIYIGTSTKREVYDSLQESFRGLLQQAESGRNHVANLRTSGAFNEERMLKEVQEKLASAPDKVAAVKETTFFRTIPIIAAIQIASEQFKGNKDVMLRVPKIQPRNKANEPDPVELVMLKRLETENLPELFQVDRQNNFIRYMRPIRLTKDCLICHGTVADSRNKDGLDLMGIKMEGWKEGEIHGAFELVQRLETVDSLIRKKLVISFLLTAAVSVAVIFVVIVMIRRLLRVLGGEPSQVRDIANLVAAGDLTMDVTVKGTDTDSILHGMKTMVANLRELVTKTVNVSSMITSSSQELLTTSEQMATGAEEVAAQANTVATAGEEMSATSNDIARNCQMAAQSGDQANQAAKSGAEVVNETVQIMGRIASRVSATALTVRHLGERSDQIGAIIGTIEDIADQTNLLALNAAIEAARAGDQGRGFAVVADEVRALAERTTRATKEISEMIKAIQKETREVVDAMEEGVREVEVGTGEAARSGQALQQILDQISDVTMQVNQIATAAEEQTAVTGEISGNIHQITEVVQATAKGAVESAGAAEQLANQARELIALVGKFRLP